MSASHRGTADLLAIASGFAVSFALAIVLAFFANRHYTPVHAGQPAQFNHRVHVEDEGLECSTCHAFFEEETRSGLPEAALCALCHAEPQGESLAEAELVQLLEQGDPLEWRSVFRQPPHVFFSHRRHVAVAELECTTCHGEIGSSERSPREGRALAMDTCVDCHQSEGVSNACSRCHR